MKQKSSIFMLMFFLIMLPCKWSHAIHCEYTNKREKYVAETDTERIYLLQPEKADSPNSYRRSITTPDGPAFLVVTAAQRIGTRAGEPTYVTAAQVYCKKKAIAWYDAQCLFADSPPKAIPNNKNAILYLVWKEVCNE